MIIGLYIPPVEKTEYQVTIRDKNGDKIISKVRVVNPDITIREIVDTERERQSHLARLKSTKFGLPRGDIRYYWYPKPLPPPEKEWPLYEG